MRIQREIAARFQRHRPHSLTLSMTTPIVPMAGLTARRPIRRPGIAGEIAEEGVIT